MQSSELLARTRSAPRQLWRVLFIIYAIALTVSTHWPQLQLPPETPASDKTIHVVAFGILTMLLWKARWIASIWIVGTVAMIWAAIDEASQGLPGVNRHASREDFIANAIGVMIAIALIMIVRVTTRAFRSGQTKDAGM